MAITIRLVYFPRAQGGLGNATGQEAAAENLDALLNAAVGREWSEHILCDQHLLSWEPPRLLAGGAYASGPPCGRRGLCGHRGVGECVTPFAKPLLKALASAVAAWVPGHAVSQGGSTCACDLLRICMPSSGSQGSKWQFHKLFQQLCIRVGD